MENIIEVKKLKKVYSMGKEEVYALKGIDLTIKKGEFCSLLGKSGSGKSTLLNMMAGLEKPTEGSVIIDGKPIESLNENAVTRIRKHYIGFIFQSYNLLPSHTALENVMLPLIFNDMPKKQRIEKGKEILSAVGLGDRYYHKPNQMSGGQQQRVSIARAFVNNPSIIFADEPTGNLDSKTENEIMDLIVKMKQTYDQTIVMVTHDEETSKHADRIITIKDGFIEDIQYSGGKKNENKD